VSAIDAGAALVSDPKVLLLDEPSQCLAPLWFGGLPASSACFETQASPSC
jgi:ABC-type branched-subunit amino acid transport system ATPase component